MRPRPLAALGLAAALAIALAGAAARAEWMQPDPSYREAQLDLKLAARDTAGHGDDPGRLDSVGVALLRLARLDDAASVFRRVRDLRPDDAAALAGLGKIALFRDRVPEAESLLALARGEPGADADLFAARLRRGDWSGAAALCAEVGQEGRAGLLAAMAEAPVYQIVSGPEQTKVPWVRAFPAPLVRVRLNGTSMLMAVDTGAGDVLLDAWALRRARIAKLPASRMEFWSGSRIAAGNALIQRLEIGGMRVERVPAGIVSLRKWSLEVNPYGERVAGIIGINFLRQFTPTLDFAGHQLELRRPSAPFAPPAGAQRVPFEIWGENELTVYGSIAGGRRMAMVVQSGVPGCGVGAPPEVFEEVGVKPGMLSRIAKGAGQWLQGRPWMAVLVPVVTVGPVAQDKVQGWSGALDPAELWRHGVRRDALLSGDFFRDWRVTIDWQTRELVIES